MKKTHLNLSDRINIQSCLNMNKNFTEISNEINFSVSCILREVSNYSISVKKGAYGKKFNNCKFNYSCKNPLYLKYCLS